MEDSFPDAVGHVLEMLRMGLLACAHHFSDYVDGEGEGVELLPESCDRQTETYLQNS